MKLNIFARSISRGRIALPAVALCALLYSGMSHADENFLMDPMPHKPAAPGFKLPDLTGKPHDLREFSGKYVLVNFWSVDCVPCMQEMPALHHQYEMLKKEGLEVVGIHAGPGGDGEIEQFLESNPVGFTVLVDFDLKLGDWGIPGLPTTYLVGPKGRMLYRSVGDRNWSTPLMTDFLRSVLKPKDPPEGA